MKSSAIFYYVSGHGYGHAVRSAEVICALNHLRPDMTIIVRSSAPAGIFKDSGCRFTYHSGTYDIGVVQSDGLTMNIPETIRQYRDLSDDFPDLEKEEIHAARKAGIGGIISDVPSFAFRVSSALGIPGVAISNFSWDWIYEEWEETYPDVTPLLADIREEYTLCDRLFRLPFSVPLSVFQSEETVPMIGRKARLNQRDVRKRLHLPQNRPLILISFGGLGLKSASLAGLQSMTSYTFLSVGSKGFPCREISHSELTSKGILYQDLVGASDIVVSKPGYGIVTECVANQTPLLYTDRGPFREYDIITEQLRTILPALYIDRVNFESGTWEPWIENLLSGSFHRQQISCLGAEVIAKRFEEMMR
jgi:hypothetical protein